MTWRTMADIFEGKEEIQECPYKNLALMNYECEGQMSIMDFLADIDCEDKK